MSTQKLFGTDGIRDVANQGALTPENVLRIGKAVGYLMHSGSPVLEQSQVADSSVMPKIITDDSPCCGKVLIGRDTRRSCHMIESALVSGLLSCGVDVVTMGVLPTPVVAFLTRKWQCPLGIVISASHNPVEDNGIKFFSFEGLKISDECEAAIEDAVAKLLEGKLDTPSSDIGTRSAQHHAAEIYIDDVISQLDGSLSLKGMKIVMDCSNGATSYLAPPLFSKLGAEVIAINNSPTGLNINDGCGALHPEVVQEEVMSQNADIGLSFDGDGDRVIPVDGEGNVRDGDFIMAFCARHMIEQNTLPDSTLVVTDMSNLGLQKSIEDAGGKLTRTQVGDRFVTQAMIESGYMLGGEQSGHIIFLENTTTGDAIWTALRVLQTMKETGKTLNELSECMNKYPQVLINVDVKSKPPINDVPELVACVTDVEKRMEGRGRVLLRYSGTQNMLRVMMEGPDQDEIQEMAQEIADCAVGLIGK